MAKPRILAFGQEMFIWRPFDLRFRLVIARRNPNLVLLTAAVVGGVLLVQLSIARKLGGLTGDVYGLGVELAEVAALVVFLGFRI